MRKKVGLKGPMSAHIQKTWEVSLVHSEPVMTYLCNRHLSSGENMRKGPNASLHMAEKPSCTYYQPWKPLELEPLTSLRKGLYLHKSPPPPWVWRSQTRKQAMPPGEAAVSFSPGKQKQKGPAFTTIINLMETHEFTLNY